LLLVTSSWSSNTVLELNLGDVVRLRKPHPCGGYDWQVVRLGADIGLRCIGCSRRVLIERPVLEKRLKQIVFRSVQSLTPPASL
jgi:hypothetical protein